MWVEIGGKGGEGGGKINWVDSFSTFQKNCSASLIFSYSIIEILILFCFLLLFALLCFVLN